MNKFLTCFFGILSLFFGSICVLTAIRPVKIATFKENDKKTKGLALGINNNGIKKALSGIFATVLPLTVIFKAKQIIKDHKKANKKRNLMTLAGAAGVLLWHKSKKKKSGKKQLC